MKVLKTPDWPHWEMLRALCITELQQEVVDAWLAHFMPWLEATR